MAPRARVYRRLAWRPSAEDRKSTRLNSSHGYISYAVFCLKKKTGLVGRTLMFHTAAGVRATMKERAGGHRIGFGTSICWDHHQHKNLPDVGNMILFPADLQGPIFF